MPTEALWVSAAMDFPQHSQHVLEQLNQQRQLGLLCDCTFVVDGVDFKAHKAVLAACSEYFKMLFVDQKDVVHLDISNAAGTPLAQVELAEARSCGWPQAMQTQPGRHLQALGGSPDLPCKSQVLSVYQVPATFWGPLLTGSRAARAELNRRVRGKLQVVANMGQA